jgi:hypothetical protein
MRFSMRFRAPFIFLVTFLSIVVSTMVWAGPRFNGRLGLPLRGRWTQKSETVTTYWKFRYVGNGYYQIKPISGRKTFWNRVSALDLFEKLASWDALPEHLQQTQMPQSDPKLGLGEFGEFFTNGSTTRYRNYQYVHYKGAYYLVKQYNNAFQGATLMTAREILEILAVNHQLPPNQRNAGVVPPFGLPSIGSFTEGMSTPYYKSFEFEFLESSGMFSVTDSKHRNEAGYTHIMSPSDLRVRLRGCSGVVTGM